MRRIYIYDPFCSDKNTFYREILIRNNRPHDMQKLRRNEGYINPVVPVE